MKSSALKSQASWLCLSEAELKQAREIIAAAGPESTVDALGLGTPVEAISDLLFPGTSTLHTELRYVIFIPAILYGIQEAGGAQWPSDLLKSKENELINSLLGSGLKQGVIGRSRGKDLKYWPSTTYWTAVNSYRTLGSTYYDRSTLLEKLTKTKTLELISDDGESTSDNKRAFVGDESFSPIARSIFSDFKKMTWPEKVDFKLRKVEARFLIQKIQEVHPNSMYADILALPTAKLSAINTLFEVKHLRPDLKTLLEECRNFSTLAMGATYAYRWVLCNHIAEQRNAPELKAEWSAYRDRNAELYNQWRAQNLNLKFWRMENLTKAFIEAFPHSKRSINPIDRATETFCDDCCETIFAKGKNSLIESGKLAQQREEKLKGNRSRFRDESIEIPENVRAVPETEYRNQLYDFRWGWGQRNAITMLEGLGKK